MFLNRRILILMTLPFLLFGCGGGAASPVVSDPVTSSPPTPPPTDEIPFLVPTAESDTSVITGQLLTPGPGGEPFFATLYLASTIKASDENFPPMIAFSENVDPNTMTDQSGRFVFSGVTPGEYALVIWTPVGSTVIMDLENNPDDYLIFNTEPGQVTDLGIIPIP